MSPKNWKDRNWPMNRILGGIFLAAFALLITLGMQSRSPEEGTRPVATPRVERLPAPEPSPAMTAAAPLAAGESEPPPESTNLLAAPPDFAEAEASYRAEDYALAAEHFTRYREAHPANPWGPYMLGLCEWKQGRLEAAGSALRECLALDAAHVKARLNLARVLMAAQRQGEALTLLDEAEAAALQMGGEGQRLRGRALHGLGRAAEARDAYALALTLDPGDAWSLNNLGLLFVESERFADALAAFALAVDLDGQRAIFKNNLGVALERLGHGSAAAEAYRSALALDADHAKARTSLARVTAAAVDEGPSPDLATLAAVTAAALTQGGFPWQAAPADSETVAGAEPAAEPETPAAETQITQLP